MNTLVYGEDLNIVVAFLIIIRIVFFSSSEIDSHPLYLWGTWILAVSCCALIVWTYLGYATLAEFSEVTVNIFTCIAIYSFDGDLSRLKK